MPSHASAKPNCRSHTSIPGSRHRPGGPGADEIKLLIIEYWGAAEPGADRAAPSPCEWTYARKLDDWFDLSQDLPDVTAVESVDEGEEARCWCMCRRFACWWICCGVCGGGGCWWCCCECCWSARDAAVESMARRPAFIRAINDKLERPNEIWRDLPAAFISRSAPNDAERFWRRLTPRRGARARATNRRPTLAALPCRPVVEWPAAGDRLRPRLLRRLITLSTVMGARTVTENCYWWRG